MPYGFFTIEQFTRLGARRGKRTGRRATARWIPAKHLDARNTLTSAIEWIEAQGKPGFYRVTQTQRMVWAEETGSGLRLHRWHAGSPEALERTAKTLDRNGTNEQAMVRRRKMPKK
jgi:hypothetical protein